MPGGRLVDGVFVLNDADEGGEPSQPEVVSPYGDRAQCECVHLVTVQRWDPDTESYDPEQTTFRCTTFVGDADFEFGWRFCTRCRPPFVTVARRARSIMHMVMARIQQLGLVLDPPMDPEATRLRHLGIIARSMPPWCQCACDRCLYRIRFDHDTPAARRQRHANDLVAVQEDIELILLSQEAEMALWAIPAVWIPTDTMAEWKNTMLAIVHNIWNGVLDRLGEVPDQEGPLMVD